MGEQYAEVIYENVLNYIDNVSNVDLCKIKSLQSMMQVVGLKYSVLDAFKSIPVEVANLMDVLSINKSYLLRSGVFKKYFTNYLRSISCITDEATPDYGLSNEVILSSDAWEGENRKISVLSTHVDEGIY